MGSVADTSARATDLRAARSAADAVGVLYLAVFVFCLAAFASIAALVDTEECWALGGEEARRCIDEPVWMTTTLGLAVAVVVALVGLTLLARTQPSLAYRLACAIAGFALVAVWCYGALTPPVVAEYEQFDDVVAVTGMGVWVGVAAIAAGRSGLRPWVRPTLFLTLGTPVVFIGVMGILWV